MFQKTSKLQFFNQVNQYAGSLLLLQLNQLMGNMRLNIFFFL